MTWNYLTAVRAALRFARREARRRKILLGRFKQIHPIGTEVGDAGPEWLAVAYRCKGYATVWYPIGDDRRKEALEHCTMTKEYGTYLFGFNFKEPNG